MFCFVSDYDLKVMIQVLKRQATSLEHEEFGDIISQFAEERGFGDYEDFIHHYEERINE